MDCNHKCGHSTTWRDGNCTECTFVRCFVCAHIMCQRCRIYCLTDTYGRKRYRCESCGIEAYSLSKKQ